MCGTHSHMQSAFTVKVGMAYHIKDEYFDLTQGCDIKKNSGGKTYPACCCFIDKEKSIFWMIPMSTNISKYKRIQDKEFNKYGNHISVVIGEYDGKEVAFQIQGMFPVVKKHILHPHTRKGRVVPIDKFLLEEIQNSFFKMRRLAQKDIACIMTDVQQLEKIMLYENGESGESFYETI